MAPVSHCPARVVEGGRVFGSVAHDETGLSPRMLPLVPCGLWLHLAYPSELGVPG